MLVSIFKRWIAEELFLTFHDAETGELLFPVQQLTSTQPMQIEFSSNKDKFIPM